MLSLQKTLDGKDSAPASITTQPRRPKKAELVALELAKL